MHLVNTSGTIVASYTYDPWGKVEVSPSTSVVANANPLRYRGYYYDAESGFYYLQSRYYDPTIGRFINADSFVSTGQGFLGYNMFAYCNNNPVSYVDYSGKFLIEISVSSACAIVVLVICGVAAVHFGAMLLCTLFDWLTDQWFYLSAQLSFIYESDVELDMDEVACSSYNAPDPFDDDDDYWDDESNFGGTQKVGKQKGNTPQNNQKQNADFERLVKELDLSPKEARNLHDNITGQGLDYQGMLEYAKAIFMLLID